MRIPRPLLLVFVTSAFACCVDAPQALGPIASTNDPSQTAAALATPDPAVDPLAAPRPLEVGDWWTVHASGDYFQQDLTATLVVAQATADAILLGVADGPPRTAGTDSRALDDCPTCGIEPAYDILLETHIPPIGPLTRATLAFESHEHLFEPLHFPLTLGANWDTSWWGIPTHLEVAAIDGPRATIAVSNEWDPDYATLVYDGELGFLRSFTIPGYARFEVTAHGAGFHGAVQAPRTYDVLVDDGRWRAVYWGPDPESPLVTFDVPTRFNRLSVGIVLEASQPGLFDLQLRSPHGNEHTYQLLPSDGAQRRVAFLGETDPAGTWNVRFTAGGDGAVIVEGIGSEAVLVTL